MQSVLDLSNYELGNVYYYNVSNQISKSGKYIIVVIKNTRGSESIANS